MKEKMSLPNMSRPHHSRNTSGPLSGPIFVWYVVWFLPGQPVNAIDVGIGPHVVLLEYVEAQENALAIVADGGVLLLLLLLLGVGFVHA
jgi:hypothetical protein